MEHQPGEANGMRGRDKKHREVRMESGFRSPSLGIIREMEKNKIWILRQIKGLGTTMTGGVGVESAQHLF